MNLPVPYDPEFAMWQALCGHAMKFELVGTVELAEPVRDLWDSIIDPIFGRSIWFDRQGHPITCRRWGELREVGLDEDGHYGERSYVRVGEDKIGDTTVSTVWLGHDHGFPTYHERESGDYRPVIFETMIFGGEFDERMRRYCTEEEAARGHREAVLDIRAGMRPWWSYGGEEDDAWHWAGGTDATS